MLRTGLAIGVASTMAACGAHAASSAFPADDASASSRDGDVPDGPFPCGAQPGLTCEAAQVCIVGCSGGPIFCAPVADGGACPSGYALSAACPGDAAPCSSSGTTYPTVCVDDVAAAPCPDPGTTGARTYECNCPL